MTVGKKRKMTRVEFAADTSPHFNLRGNGQGNAMPVENPT
jgi:hypothetical protein